MRRFAAPAALILAAAIWGGGFIAQADAMRGLGPFSFTVLRYLVAAVALLPMAWWEGRRPDAKPLRPHGRLLVLVGLSFSVASVLQQLAITATSVTHVGFLTGLYVLFVPLLGAALFRERPHRIVLVAAVAALAGTWLIGGGLDGIGAGDGLAIGCALGFAVQILLLDRAVAHTGRPASIIVIQSLVCAAVTSPLGLAAERFSPAGLVAVWPALLFAGVLSGGVGFLLQAVGQSATAPAVAAVLLMSESLFAALFAALLLGERLTAEGWAGCGLLFASLLIAQAVPTASPASVGSPGAPART